MMYPLDPHGPIGPQYPEGFTKWYLAIIAGLLLLAVFMSGCSLNPGKDIAVAIAQNCEKYSTHPTQADVERCFTDSEFVLGELE